MFLDRRNFFCIRRIALLVRHVGKKCCDYMTHTFNYNSFRWLFHIAGNVLLDQSPRIKSSFKLFFTKLLFLISAFFLNAREKEKASFQPNSPQIK